MISPELTVMVSGTTAETTYTFSLYSASCDSTALATKNCVGTEPCTLSVSGCVLSERYYTSVYNPLNTTIQYQISQNVQDLATNETPLVKDQNTNVTLEAFASQTYYIQIDS